MLGFKLPGLVINTKTPGLYPTTLKESKIKALKERLDNFDFRMGTKEQYMEVESIMNILNGTLENEADQMDLAGLFLVLNKIKYHRETWRQQPDQFVNVLLKIVERIKGQVGGMKLKNVKREALLRNVLSNKKKRGGTRKNKLQKSNTPEFRKQVINTIRSRINLTNTHKAMLIQRYEDAAKAGLATPNEISALVTLAQLKTTRRRR